MKESNRLFPVFLTLENLRLLIVGGGSVALEKLNAVVNNAPATNIKLVALAISDDIYALASQHPTIFIIQKAYDLDDWMNIDIGIIAVNDIEVATAIRQDARQKGILVNVADKPELCDFYLGSIVQKGNLKIAISTNGKSPTIAKRIKEAINDLIPDEIEITLQQIHRIRQSINGDFKEKVKQLNELTRGLISNGNSKTK